MKAVNERLLELCSPCIKNPALYLNVIEWSYETVHFSFFAKICFEDHNLILPKSQLISNIYFFYRYVRYYINDLYLLVELNTT